MYDFLLKLNEKVTVGVVGGSDLGKISEQMGGLKALFKFEHVFTENGLVAYERGHLVGSEVMI